MNYRLIIKTTGTVLLVEAAALLPSIVTALLFRESPVPLLLAMAIMLAAGYPASRAKPKTSHFFARDGYVTVFLIWLVLSAFGALPLFFTGLVPSYVDCFFETVSGFTTTGATILTDIEAVPKGVLFWRSFTHFIGGMGILVLANALLPSSKDRQQHLMRAEIPGPEVGKLVPRLSDSSKILYAIYTGIMLLEVVCLLFTGMDLFNAFTTAFSTAGTGGFSAMNASIAAFNNPAAEVIIGIFMMFFGINFTVYFLILTKKFRAALASEELKFYLCVIAAVTAMITLNIMHMYPDIWESIRNAFFATSSIITTTGFVTADFDTWPQFSKTLLLLLMFIGASAGSTGGAIKCSRVLMVFKSIVREVRQIIHPNAVFVIRMDGKAVDEKTLRSVMRFFAAYMVITLISTLIICLDNVDLTTAISAVAANIGNVGPGLAAVGPTCNYAFLTWWSKILLSLCMLMGRLEIFPALVFFSPSTWRKN